MAEPVSSFLLDAWYLYQGQRPSIMPPPAFAVVQLPSVPVSKWEQQHPNRKEGGGSGLALGETLV